MIYITSDHKGVNLKKHLVEKLQRNNHEVKDLGPNAVINDDDYPDYVLELVKTLEKEPQSKGIVICNNGVGVSMMANRFPHIRCALTWNPQHAVTSREDDDTNVLALPAAFIENETAYQTVEQWLRTSFTGADRHVRRLEKVENYSKDLH